MKKGRKGEGKRRGKGEEKGREGWGKERRKGREGKERGREWKGMEGNGGKGKGRRKERGYIRAAVFTPAEPLLHYWYNSTFYKGAWAISQPPTEPQFHHCCTSTVPLKGA